MVFRLRGRLRRTTVALAEALWLIGGGIPVAAGTCLAGMMLGRFLPSRV